MRNSKTSTVRFSLLLQAALLCAVLSIFASVAGCLTGCSTTRNGEKKFGPLVFLTGSTNDIERKAYHGTRIIVREVLREGRTNAIPKLQIASENLLELENAPLITPEQVLNIIENLPKGVIKNPDRFFSISDGILLMTDEGGTIGALNPEQHSVLLIAVGISHALLQNSGILLREPDICESDRK